MFKILEMDKHLGVAICPFPNFGKFGKHAPDVATLPPLWGFTVLSLVTAQPRETRMIGQLKLSVQDEASLTPAATRAGFSTAPRPQVDNAHDSHSVAATIRSPEVRVTAITHERLCWNDHSDKSER